jgi:sulfite oxidase
MHRFVVRRAGPAAAAAAGATALLARCHDAPPQPPTVVAPPQSSWWPAEKAGDAKTTYGMPTWQAMGAPAAGVDPDFYTRTFHASSPRAGEPRYSAAEVRERDGVDGRRLWVTFRGGVHDVTQFVKEHPGGQYLHQAAGGDVEPFWRVWSYHLVSQKAAAALEATRIGALADAPPGAGAHVSGREMIAGWEAGEDDPYAGEPPRDWAAHASLVDRPLVSETRNEALRIA